MTKRPRRTPTHLTLSEVADNADLSSRELASLRGWLAELLVANEYAKLGQAGHTKSEVPLRRVFVDLPAVSMRGRTDRELFLSEFMQSTPLELSLLTGSREPKDDDDQSEPGPTSIPHKQPWRVGAATLLIGGPGQGKSTLAQLACQLHRAALLQPFEHQLQSKEREVLQSFYAKGARPSRLGIKLPSKPLLPVHVALPELAAWMVRRSATSGGSLPPTVLDFVTQLPSAKKSGLAASTLLTIAPLLPLLIVLDGFDEVGAAADRESIVSAARELVATLAQSAASAQLLATTRPQGYAGELSRIGIPLAERVLVPLELPEAMEYARKLVDAKISSADQRTKTMERLRDAADSPATARLLTTPLQVTIVAALVQQGRAPKERWRLFWSYFDYTYKREIERETYASTLLAENRSQIEAIHTRVALLLQVEAERAGGATARMSSDQLKVVVNAVLEEEGLDNSSPDRVDADLQRARTELVADILKAAEERLVFLVEPEPGSFGFEIRSLQEFMAAWALSVGPDTLVKARLLQIGRAPMFRNALLFAASKLYSESSHLRDFLPDTLCAHLDLDALKTVGADTGAGAMLALEILEEGAVLNQPRFAAALLVRACALLDLPASQSQARVARVAADSLGPVLRDEIEARLTAATHDAPPAGTWVCLLESLNLNRTWARALADNYRTDLELAPALISFSSAAAIPINAWLLELLEVAATQNATSYDVIFDALHMPIDGSRVSWGAWLTQSLSRVSGIGEPVVRFRDAGSLRIATRTEPTSAAPQSWEPLVAVARFNNSPTSDSLAHALESIARIPTDVSWFNFGHASFWPLLACLNVSDGAEDLLSLAERVRRRELGDIADWKQMESAWGDNLTIGLPQDPSSPWSLADDAHTPPFAGFQYWALRFFLRRTHHLKLDSAAKLFSEATSRVVKRRLGEVCLALLHTAKQRTLPDEDVIAEWLVAVPYGASALVPRPKALPLGQWRKLLGRFSTSAFGWGMAQTARQLITACAESHGHPLPLRLLLRTFDRYVERNAGRAELDLTFVELRKMLREVDEATNELRAYLAIGRLWGGEIETGTEADLVAQVAPLASADREVWMMFFRALELGRIIRSQRLSILRLVFNDDRFASARASAVAVASRALLTETSGLYDQENWLRLGLPAPAPGLASNAAISLIPVSPVVISELEMRDLRGIESLQLRLAPPKQNQGQWIVILGPNGSGKTTLLRAIALASRNGSNPSLWPDDTFAVPWPRVGTEQGRITLKFGNGEMHETRVAAGRSLRLVQQPEQTRSRLFPLFGYGCRRGSALGGRSREVNLKDDGGPEVATLFSEARDIIHAETWLLILDGEARRNRAMRDVYRSVISSLVQLLDVEDVEISERQVWIVERGGRRVLFEALSDGYLTTAGWFLDLVARWIELLTRNGQRVPVDFLSQARGLVLLDEIDLHLHPRWQVAVIERTRRIFPQMSFVVTTHNPLTLVGASPEEIWILSNDGYHNKVRPGIDAPLLLTSGQILREYFDIKDIYPSELGRKMQRYGFLSGYAERSDLEQQEMEDLVSELSASGILPDWEVVERSRIKHSSKTSKARSRKSRQ